MTSNEVTKTEEQAIHEGKQVLASKQDVLIALGRLQAFQNFKNYATVAEILTFKQIRESKEYKGLVYEAEGNSATVATIEEFCTHFLGRSYRSLKEAEDQLLTFGEAFYETSKQIGLGNRELRALKSLPDDEQQLVIESEAVDSGDKEALKELIEDLQAQHNKALSAEKKQHKDTQAELSAARKMRDDFQQQANEVKEELEKSKFKADGWKSQVKGLLLEATKHEGNAVESLSRLCAVRDHFLNSDDIPSHATEYIAAGILDSFKTLAKDFTQAWLDTSNMLEGFIPKMRPSLEIMQELGEQAEE